MGCLPARINLRDNGALQVKYDVPDGVSISAVPYESEGNFRLLGTVSRSPISAVSVKGHVDVKIVSPEEELIAEYQIRLKELPTIRHGSHAGSFSFSCPGLPPKGSRIEIVYNPLNHDHLSVGNPLVPDGHK